VTVGGGVCAAAAVADKKRVVMAIASARFAFLAMYSRGLLGTRRRLASCEYTLTSALAAAEALDERCDGCVRRDRQA